MDIESLAVPFDLSFDVVRMNKHSFELGKAPYKPREFQSTIPTEFV